MSVQPCQTLHQCCQTNGFDCLADRIAVRPAMHNEASGRFQVFARFMKPPRRPGRVTAFDLDRPAFAPGQFQHQIDFSAASRAVETGHGERGRRANQVLDHKPFPTGAHDGVTEQRGVVANIEQCVEQANICMTLAEPI